VRGLLRATQRELAPFELELPASLPKLRIDQRHAGSGYAVVTPESLAACARLDEHGIHLEPVYTGKAMSALLADAAQKQMKSALFWQTARREPLEHPAGWEEKLPPALARRLRAHLLDPTGKKAARRRVLVGVAAAVGALALGVRITGYEDVAGLSVLSPWEAQVLGAAAEALLPPGVDAATQADVAARVDRYLVGMPPKVLRDVHAMLALIEHGTTPLGLRLHRFTALSRDEREAYLTGLAAHGGLLAQAYDALRQLCMLGYYQRSSTWAAIGYEGPRVPLDYDPRGPGRMAFPDYDKLRAPDGALPASVIR
jgi:D-cysteine desulfhydrase